VDVYVAGHEFDGKNYFLDRNKETSKKNFKKK